MKVIAAPSRGGVAATADGTIYVSDVNAGVVTLIRNDQIADVIKADGRPHGLSVDPATGDVYTSSTNASNWNDQGRAEEVNHIRGAPSALRCSCLRLPSRRQAARRSDSSRSSMER